MKFCVMCGVGIKSGVFCKDCTPKEENITALSIQVCGSCGAIFWQNRWQKKDLTRIVSEHVDGKVKKIDIPEKKKKMTIIGKKGTCDVTLIPARCPTCQKERIGYFQGILQIRTKKQSLLESAFAVVKKELGEMNVPKVVEYKDGVDLYMPDKRKMRGIARTLHERFGGLISENAQLFSRNSLTSKDIFRLNVKVTLPHYAPGDVIEYKGFPVLVTGAGGENLITRKRTAIVYDPQVPVMTIQKTTIATVAPRIEAYHPETNQPEPVQNISAEKFGLGEKIDVIIFKKGIYLVPRSR